MTNKIVRFRYGVVRIEIADLEPDSMTWGDLKATLIGIWLLVTNYGYSERSLGIAQAGDWVELGQFFLMPPPPLPTPLPSGLKQPSSRA